jgi:KTSC domain
MNRQRVSSSDVASVGYDPLSSTLEVEFHSGGIYRYFNVPERHYLNLTSGAGSVGRYLNAEIKNVYRYQRVG